MAGSGIGGAVRGGGILIGGQVVTHNLIRIYNAADFAWCQLDPGDYSARRTLRPHLIIDHTTGGLWPQEVIAGAGPAGHAKDIAQMWSGQDHGGGLRIHSGAQILVDFDGAVYCLADLASQAAYHAEMANDVSIGIEHCTTSKGAIYQATIDSSVILHKLICDTMLIPWQVNAAPYRNAPLARCETGAKSAAHDGRIQSRCGDSDLNIIRSMVRTPATL